MPVAINREQTERNSQKIYLSTNVKINDILTDKIGGAKLKQDKETNKETVYAVMVPKERHNEPEIIDAKKQEIENWKNFNAFEIVEDIGQPTITTRWVINEKESHDGLKVRHKARLCLRGFMEQEKPRSDSPTISPDMTHYIRRRPGKISERIKLIGQTKNFFQDLKPWMSTNRSPLDAVLIS